MKKLISIFVLILLLMMFASISYGEEKSKTKTKKSKYKIVRIYQLKSTKEMETIKKVLKETIRKDLLKKRRLNSNRDMLKELMKNNPGYWGKK